MKKMIFVCYGGGHVAALLPVIKAMKMEKEYTISVVGLTTAYKLLIENGIETLGFKDLYQYGHQEAMCKGKELVSRNDLHPAVSYDESVAYTGLSYMDLVERHGEMVAENSFSTLGRQCFFPINVFTRFFEHLSPDIVIATSSPRAEYAALMAASNLGVNSVCLVNLFPIQEAKWVGRNDFASKVCVLSEYVKVLLIENGRNSSDIVVTGNPAFDGLAKLRWPHSEEKRKKTILWASQIESETHPKFPELKGDPLLPVKIEEKICEIAKKWPDVRFVLRHHPSENREYASGPTNVEVSDSKFSIHKQLSQTDILVTISSTVALEAALLGRHTVTMDMSIFSKDTPFSKMGISRGVNSLDELENVLLELLHTAPSEIPGLPDVGKSTDQVVSVIKNLCFSTDYTE